MKSYFTSRVLSLSAVYFLLFLGVTLGGIATLMIGVRQFSNDAVPNYPLNSAQLFMVGTALMIIASLMSRVYDVTTELVLPSVFCWGICFAVAFWSEYGALVKAGFAYRVGGYTVHFLLGGLIVVSLAGWAVYHDFFSKRRLVSKMPTTDQAPEAVREN